jgi:hypothetical protein
MVDVYESMTAIEKIITGQHMKDLETAREQNKYNEDLLEAIRGLKPKAPEKKEKDGEFSWLGLAGSLIAGLVMGGMAFVKNYVQGFMRFWGKVAKSLKLDVLVTKIFTTMEEGWMFIKNLVGEGFAKAWSWIKGFFGENKLIATISEFFGKVVKGLKAFFNWEELLPEFKILWQSIKDIFAMISKPITKLFSGGGGFFSDILKSLEFFSPITKFFKAFGAILGKLAYPLQIIMSIWDTVKGALDGWNNTEGDFIAKFFGAMKGALSGLLNGLIGGLLDLLKDGLSWILEALGFDKAAKILDSFSFSDLITKVVGGFYDMVEGLVRWVIDLFKNPGKAMDALGEAVGKLGDMAKNLLKGILKSALPNPQGSLAEKIASKAIPDAVYEFAGLNPKTGTELAAATTENVAEKGTQMVNQAAAAGQQAVQGVVNAGQTVINNGNTAIVSAKSKIQDMEDMFARGWQNAFGH